MHMSIYIYRDILYVHVHILHIHDVYVCMHVCMWVGRHVYICIYMYTNVHIPDLNSRRI